MLKPPCHNCPDRTIGVPNCHDTCEKYLAFRAKREKISQARKASRVFNDYIHDHHKPAEQTMLEMQRRGVK